MTDFEMKLAIVLSEYKEGLIDDVHIIADIQRLIADQLKNTLEIHLT